MYGAGATWPTRAEEEQLIAAQRAAARLPNESERKLLAIAALLDRACIAVDSTDVVWRVMFALELTNRYSDELSNIRLGLRRPSA